MEPPAESVATDPEPRADEAPAPDGPERPSRRAVLIGGAAAAAAAVGTGAALWAARDRTPGLTDVLRARWVDGDLPLDDPSAPAWADAPAGRLETIRQDMTQPHQREVTVPELRARALTNGRQLGFHLEWADGSADDTEPMDRFRDAVAIMLPMRPGAAPAPITMGGVDDPVYILQWKASWQRDVDHGFQGTGELFPGSFNDVYPGHPTLTELGLDEAASEVFYPGRSVGNLSSQVRRRSPVEEIRAEGFGSTAPLDEQRAQGRGVHADGRWRVVLGTPEGPGVPSLATRGVHCAFAVWNGSARERGGRKQYVDWVLVELPEPR